MKRIPEITKVMLPEINMQIFHWASSVLTEKDQENACIFGATASMGGIAWSKYQSVNPYNIIKEYKSNESIHQMSEGNRLDVSRVSHKGSPMVVVTDHHYIVTILKPELCKESNN